jgi:three-Cys-motif partner protein
LLFVAFVVECYAASEKVMAVTTKPDPSDGLPALEAQEWAEEKHGYVRRYLGISSEARRKFLKAGGKATYTELFAGPGRLFLKGTDHFFDGSPLVAWKESQRTATEFIEVHMCDEQAAFCKIVDQRLTALGAKVKTHPLKADAAARRVARLLEHTAINVAFLDPFNLGDLPFTIIETFSQLRRIDLIVHVSAMDLIRQLPGALAGQLTTLDNFAPGWRQALGASTNDEEARGKFIEYWLQKTRGLGFQDARIWKLIKGPTNQPLYWLVLIAKHPLAAQFWDEVNKPDQGALF